MPETGGQALRNWLLNCSVPSRNDWAPACSDATPLLGLRGLPLIQALGYDTAPRGSAAVLLTDSGTSRAIAVLLDEIEVFDRAAARFGAVSPVAHGLAVAAVVTRSPSAHATDLHGLVEPHRVLGVAVRPRSPPRRRAPTSSGPSRWRSSPTGGRRQCDRYIVAGR